MRKGIPLEIEGCSECEKLESRLAEQAEIIAVMREALEYYNDDKNYPQEGVAEDDLYCDVLNDCGYKAQEALAKAEEMLK